MQALGWTAEQVDRHDLFDVAALAKHWRTAPPVHVSLAGLLGLGHQAASSFADAPTPSRPATKDLSDAEVDAQSKMMQGVAQAFASGMPR